MQKPCFNGRICREEILPPPRPASFGYDWKVIHDPTRTWTEPGLFLGGLFRMVDLRLDRDEKSTWPDGIIFEHVLTGQRLTFENGRLLDMTHQLFLGRKPRERIKKGNPLSSSNFNQTNASQMRRFLLIRDRDASGISGTGTVAEGIVFTDGQTVLRWLKKPFATGIYQTLHHLIEVHGHEGETQLQFIDGTGSKVKQENRPA